MLDLVGENVLYVDTDSCVYLSKPECPQPPLGDYLGELTNEVTGEYGEGMYITDFVCVGPKNYAYQINNGKQKCKIRGFTLNYKNSQVLNFETMKEMVLNLDNRITVKIVNESKISREPHTHRMFNKREEKSYQVVYDKRIIMDEGADTIPFGYHWSSCNPCTVVTPPVPRSLVSNNILDTLIQPSICNVSDQGMEIDDVTNGVVNLMETDDETDFEPSEN